MAVQLNRDIASRLDEVAALYADQGANRFRVQAYQHAAAAVRTLEEPVSEIFARDGLAGLENIPSVGPSIARAIRELLVHGTLAMLDRLRGEHDPIAILRTVPGIGKSLAWKLHDDLGIDSLIDLETAAHDGRLEHLADLGAKRLAGIRDSLAHRLGRVRGSSIYPPAAASPTVGELLEVDAEYRRRAASNQLKRIAPRRFNPTHEAWLPVLHATRGQRHYTALFSNTAHAHGAGKTHDWVVIHCDGRDGDHQYTVITSQFGDLKGRRIVRGRETECAAHYRQLGQPDASAVAVNRAPARLG